MKIFDRNELPPNLLLTTRQNSKLRNAFQNFEYFFGGLLSNMAGPLMKVAVPLAKNILTPLRITAAVSAIDVRYQKKIHGSLTVTPIISNEETSDVIKIA